MEAVDGSQTCFEALPQGQGSRSQTAGAWGPRTTESSGWVLESYTPTIYCLSHSPTKGQTN